MTAAGTAAGDSSTLASDTERNLRLTIDGEGIFADALRANSQAMFNILMDENLINGNVIVTTTR